MREKIRWVAEAKNKQRAPQHQIHTMASWYRWLPAPGNILFTLMMIGLLVLTQRVWANNTANAANIDGPNASTINYQGRLANSSGHPQDGSFDMTFSLWNTVSGGSQVWGPESHSDVPVSNGQFNVGLGSQTAGGIPTTAWNGDRYLQIAVNGETLTPRELLRSVPVANRALFAERIALVSTHQIVRDSVTVANYPQETRVGDKSLMLTNPGKFFVQCNATLKPHSSPTSWVHLRALAIKGEITVTQEDMMYQGTSSSDYVSWSNSGILELPEEGTWTIQCGLGAAANSPVLHTYSITAFQIE